MLDFLEGALLGRLWCDSDFENRRYHGLKSLWSAAIWLSFFFVFYKVNRSGVPGLLHHGRRYLILSFVIFLISPLLSYFYYRLFFLLRYGILALQTVKFAAIFLYIFNRIAPFMKMNLKSFYQSGLNFFDATYGVFIESFSERYREIGMFIAIILLAGISLLAFFAITFVLYSLPIWILRLTAYLQRVYDELLILIIDHHRLRRLRKRLQLMDSGSGDRGIQQPQ
ncbi:MAG: hypothetical protein Q4P72_02580 [Eubacteriales bacterium]|nr:hypothetical protein [Eubacteriales bacterium]